MNKMVFVAAVGLFVITSCKKDKTENKQEPVVITANGDITAKLNEFRLLLGDPVNTTTGVTTGRREINWDAVPDEFAAKSLPHDFFNPLSEVAPASRKRGLTYDPGGNGDFRVSATGFAEVSTANAAQLKSFSGTKTFTNISSSDWELNFQVAGTATPAFIRGFGMVFTDVDISSSTSLEFFSGNKSLGKFYAPVQSATGNHSFLGVYFPDEKITRIKVLHGNGLLSNDMDISLGGTKDIVAMDDFLYNEPEQF